MKLPILDARDANDILETIQTLAKSYTPEWGFSADSPDFGVALAQIFSNMTAKTLNLYNRVPFNYYLTFLNLLGANYAPPISAKGYVSVAVQPDIDGVYIEKDSLVYAQAPTDTGKVFYRLQDALYADSVQIEEILCTDGTRDVITLADPKAPFRAFDHISQENLQEHILYLKQDILFGNVQQSDISLSFSNEHSQLSQRILEYYLPQTQFQALQNGTWQTITDSTVEGNRIRLHFTGQSEKTEICAIEGHFLRCVLPKIPSQPIHVTKILCAAQGKDLPPSSLCAEEVDLSHSAFFPFQEHYGIYDSFYVSCEEAFCKEGARVSLTVEMEYLTIPPDVPWQAPDIHYKNIMKTTDFDQQRPLDTSIDQVVWEYFNGQGWVKLFPKNEYQHFFSPNETERTLSFLVPEQWERTIQGGFEARFLRARIARVNNPYSYGGNFITPFIASLSFSYSYEEHAHRPIDAMVIRSNLVERVFDLHHGANEPLFQVELPKEPAMYWRLSKAMTEGPIRILLDIEANTIFTRPPLHWEYLAQSNDGKGIWKSLDVSDKTKHLANTGIVTIMGKRDFHKATLFGREGYFLRLLNLGRSYSETPFVRLPHIRSIHFNTVPLLQKNAQQTEYFFVETEECHKICTLTGQDVCEIQVWVDEKGHLHAQEERLALENPQVIPEYDSSGQLQHLWIAWKQVEHLSDYKADERVFSLDSVAGQVSFGDGIHGKLPPPSKYESIRISYATNDGTAGNVSPNAIQGFTQSIAHLETVSNHKALVGGLAKETMEEVARRNACMLSSMKRMVSLEDYHRLLPAYERRIHKVKCLPHMNQHGEKQWGTVSIAVLPNDYKGGREQFDSIASSLHEILKEQGNFGLDKILQIFEVSYVEMKISLVLHMQDYNDYHQIYQDVCQELEKFLHPIHGNFQGEGFPIGSLPTIQSIHNCILRVKNIQRIQKIDVFTSLSTEDGKTELDYQKASRHPFAVPVLGDVEITPIVKE